MELWDLYDEQRRLVGTDHLRGQSFQTTAFTWWSMCGSKTAKAST